MADVAQLGLEVDSKPVVKADKDLQNLNKTAAKTEVATKRVSSATDVVSKSFDKASRSTEQYSERLSKGVSAQRRMGLAVQNSAFQVGDFAVQVASGQSAMRAFAQQAPQLLGGFGVFGAVAGAAVGIVAALWQVVGDSTTAAQSLEQQNELLSKMAKRYDEVRSALDRLGQSPTLANIAVDTDNLIRQQTELRKQYGDAIADITNQLTLEANALTGMAQPLTEAGGLYRDFQAQIRLVASSAKTGTLSASELVASLIKLRDAAPELNSSEAVQDLIDEMQEADTGAVALAAGLDRVSASLAGIGVAASNIRSLSVELSTLKTAGIYEAAAAGRKSPSEESAAAQIKLRNAAMKEAEAQRKKNASAAISAATRQKNAEESLAQSIERKLSALQTANDAVGLSAFEQAKLTYQTELYNMAIQKGIDLTPERKASLSEDANQMAQLSVETKAANDNMKFAKSTTRGFFGDMVSGLRQGQSAWEAFGTAANNVLDKVINKLLDQFVNAIFTVGGAGTGAGGGLFTSILGGIGGLLGFASGGYTGNKSASSVAGVVHGGEYVFSKKATDRIGVGNLEGMHKRAKGYANGGYVGPSAANSNSARNQDTLHVVIGFDGEDAITPVVRKISREEGVAASQAAVNEVQRNMPKQVDAIMTRKQQRGYV